MLLKEKDQDKVTDANDRIIRWLDFELASTLLSNHVYEVQKLCNRINWPCSFSVSRQGCTFPVWFGLALITLDFVIDLHTVDFILFIVENIDDQ